MKKLFALVLTFALALTLCASAFAEGGYSGDLKVWVADAAVDFTVGNVNMQEGSLVFEAQADAGPTTDGIDYRVLDAFKKQEIGRAHV